MATTIGPWLRRHAALLTLGACISLGGWLHPEPLKQLDLAYTDQVQRWGGTSAPPPDTTPAEPLTYVCKASSGNPDFPYFTGSGYGGPLSDAVRFTTTSESDASCDGKSAGSDGREPTNAVFL